MAEPDLDLVDIRAIKVIVEGMRMAEAVEGISAGQPAQFLKALMKDPPGSALADMRPGLLPGEEPVVRLCPPHAPDVIIPEHRLKIVRKLDSLLTAVLAVLSADRNKAPAEGDVAKAQGDHFSHTEGTSVGHGQHKAVLQVFRPHDQGGGFFAGGNFGERIIHFHDRKVPAGKFFPQDKLEIFLDGAVVDVDGPRLKAPAAAAYRLVEKYKKRAEMLDGRIIDGNVVCAVEPFAALCNGSQIGFPRPRAVVDQFKDI